MTASTVQLAAEADKSFNAYLAVPSAPSGQAVVLLQEIFGINANMRGIADEYAAEGYIAVAPDLFWRQRPGVQLDPNKPEDRETATSLMKGLDQARAVDDALLAAAHVRSLPAFAGKIGAVGYCLGGKLAYLLATRPGIDAERYQPAVSERLFVNALQQNCPEYSQIHFHSAYALRNGITLLQKAAPLITDPQRELVRQRTLAGVGGS